MRHRIHAWPGSVLMLALAAVVVGDAGAVTPLRESFDLQVTAPVVPVVVDGASQLVYELHLTNFAREALVPTRVDVLDAARGNVIASFRDDALTGRLARPGAAPEGVDARAIAPGMRGVLYLELALPDGAPPQALDHRIEYAVAGSDAGASFVVEGGRAPLRSEPPVVLGAPLRGGPWAAIHDPAWERGHRRVIYTVDGRARIPGRFAIDWVRLDAEGREARGDPDRANSSYGYGADVLAVADAVVAATRDDMRDSIRVSAHPKHALGDATGNYVALDLGDGRHAFYEHLESGSVRVARGQRVRRGEVIAALGFTGDSTGPHLHFHVADAAAPLGAEGLPFVLERFEVLGAYPDIGALGKAPWTPLDDAARSQRNRERPAPNVVVRFQE